MRFCLCLSVASSEQIHEVNEYGDENAVLYSEHTIAFNGGLKGLGSVCSLPGSKGLNQDAAILHHGYGTEEGAVCGVFDGHGENGHIVSKIVRNRLPAILLSQMSSLPTKLCKREEVCVDAFKAMDKEIRKLQNLDCSCSGTTAVLVIKQGGDLVIANLGDSRAVIGTTTDNGQVKAVQLTTDLKPSVPSEAERIRKCNGRVLALSAEPHIQRVWVPYENCPGLAMSRAFGDFMVKSYGVISFPDVTNYQLKPRDQFLVLASDGVWDVLSNEDVARVAAEADSEEVAANAVAEAARDAWIKKFPSAKVDDITAVCLFLNQKKQSTKLVPW